jgi:hypothetical protein
VCVYVCVCVCVCVCVWHTTHVFAIQLELLDIGGGFLFVNASDLHQRHQNNGVHVELDRSRDVGSILSGRDRSV